MATSTSKSPSPPGSVTQRVAFNAITYELLSAPLAPLRSPSHWLQHALRKPHESGTEPFDTRHVDGPYTGDHVYLASNAGMCSNTCTIRKDVVSEPSAWNDKACACIPCHAISTSDQSVHRRKLLQCLWFTGACRDVNQVKQSRKKIIWV